MHTWEVTLTKRHPVVLYSPARDVVDHYYRYVLLVEVLQPGNDALVQPLLHQYHEGPLQTHEFKCSNEVRIKNSTTISTIFASSMDCIPSQSLNKMS